MQLSDLKPAPFNPRAIDAAALTGLGVSVQEFGDISGITWNRRNGYLVTGHQRLKVLTDAGAVLDVLSGPAGEVLTIHVGDKRFPVRVVDWDEDRHKAAMVAANSAYIAGNWEQDALDAIVKGLQDSPIADLVTPLRLDELLTPILPDIIEDDVPLPPDEAITQPGDLWVLGDHRLLCGDSRKKCDVVRLMAGEMATCVFTDPPYGVGIGAKNRLLNSVQPSGRCLADMECDAITSDALRMELLQAFVLVRQHVMANDCTVFVTAPQGGELVMMMMMMMRDAGLPVRHVLIWKKNQPTFSLGRLDYDYAHEPILLTWRARHKRPMLGTHRTSVWEIDRERHCDRHPTMKPVALYVNAYLNNSELGDVVCDIYVGSGTALIAAQQCGRQCYSLEIEPRYVDVACRRFLNFTRESPIRESDGARFADLVPVAL